MLIAGIYLYLNRDSSPSSIEKNNPEENTPTSSDASNNPKSSGEIPADYVSLLDNTMHSARLKFSVQLDTKTINESNIQVCSVSASVGSAGEKSCNEPTNYNLRYDSSSMILTITEEGEDANSKIVGIFSGCAACTYQVGLSGLKALDGTILPEKWVDIY